MKNFLLLALAAVTINLSAPSHTFAQDEDFDSELLEESEELPPPTQNLDNEITAPPEPSSGSSEPSRFRPAPRFGGGRFGAPSRSSEPSSGSTFGGGTSSNFSSSSSSGSSSTTPITGSGKIPLSDAQPEDITNKNFPDIVESFDYKDAPISDVVNAMARLTGKNFIFEQNLSGKITIIAPRKITVAEAWEAFLSTLAMNGLTVVPSGKFLKIRKIEDAKSDSIETYAGAYYPNGDQLITRIVRLKYINADDVQKTFQNIIKSNKGQMAAYEKTNSLIITDLGSNIERIMRVLEELDKPGFEEQLKVINIKNAKAKDIAELITKIINKGENKNQNTFRPASRFGEKEKDESLSLVSPDERTNSIIVVGNSQGIDRIVKLVAQLDYPLDPSESGGVYVYYVRHGEAKKIADTLNGLVQEADKKATSAAPASDPNNPAAFKPPQQKAQIFGGDIVIKADENTNSMIITANKQDYQTFLSLMGKIDIPKDQVFIEAYIVEMKSNRNFNWGVGGLKFIGGSPDAAQSDNGIARAGFNFADFGKVQDITSKGAILGFGDKNKKVSINIGGKNILVPNLLAFIQFIQSNTDSNILSTPKLLAMDNEEAFIEVGDEIPVGLTTNQGVGGAQAFTPTFKDATTSLKLTPYISPDSDVLRLNIEQKVNDISTRPILAKNLADQSQGITKRTLKTNLTLSSGDAAVLGGLVTDSDTLTEDKIPFLGDIPVLGWLFKSRSVSRQKGNLLVFLSPKIIRNSNDHKKMLNLALNQRVDWIKKSANGRDPFGDALAGLTKYADSADEFKLEDQKLDADPTESEALDIETE